jgi:phosphoribosylaminoimidazole-succinocarboxamide synthase
LIMLGVMSDEEYELLKEMTLKIGAVIRNELAAKELELYDIKFEYGRDEKGELMLIDEISAGNMRCFKDGKWLQPDEVVKFMLQ